jgi:hypothetical protein
MPSHLIKHHHPRPSEIVNGATLTPAASFAMKEWLA